MTKLQQKYEDELKRRGELEQLCEAYAKDLEDRAVKSLLDKGIISRQDTNSSVVSRSVDSSSYKLEAKRSRQGFEQGRGQGQASNSSLKHASTDVQNTKIAPPREPR